MTNDEQFEAAIEDWRKDISYLAKIDAVIFRAKQLLDNNPDDNVKEWSDADKLRVIALHFDSVELGMPSPLDWSGGDEVQRDLRRVADQLDKGERDR